MSDALGDRMKAYEDAYRIHLPNRLPVIIRVDGRAFHTYTRGLLAFDANFIEDMQATAFYLCEKISGAKFAYVQSDEISILVTNDDTLDTQPWFGNNLQKMVSVAAGMASSFFSNIRDDDNCPHFDARAFILPEAEIANYFIWRQKDCERNSLSTFAREFYSQKELNGKGSADIHDMLHEIGQNWNDLLPYLRRGNAILKDSDGGWIIDREIPIFTQDRNYIESTYKKVNIEESTI